MITSNTLWTHLLFRQLWLGVDSLSLPLCHACYYNKRAISVEIKLLLLRGLFPMLRRSCSSPGEKGSWTIIGLEPSTTDMMAASTNVLPYVKVKVKRDGLAGSHTMPRGVWVSVFPVLKSAIRS